MNKRMGRGLLCGLLAAFVLLFSSCQLIPGMGSETESETEAETVPTFTEKNTIFVLYERSGERAKATVSITGEVCLAGMTGALQLPDDATASALTAEDGVTAVVEGDEIRFALLSQTGENITEERLLFTFTTEWTEESPAVTVSDAFDEEMRDAEYTVEFYAFGK